MLWTLLLANALVVGTQAFRGIQWAKFPTKNIILVPEDEGFPSMTLAPHQKLTLKVQSGAGSPDIGFMMRPDQTIAWVDLRWCIEAGRNKDGDVVHINRCSGTPAQKWDVVPSGRGRKMIALKGTGKCLDVKVRKGGDLSGASIELRPCSMNVTESWKIDDSNTLTQQRLKFVLVLLVLVTLGLGCWFQMRRNVCMVIPSRLQCQGGLPLNLEQGVIALTISSNVSLDDHNLNPGQYSHTLFAAAKGWPTCFMRTCDRTGSIAIDTRCLSHKAFRRRAHLKMTAKTGVPASGTRVLYEKGPIKSQVSSGPQQQPLITDVLAGTVVQNKAKYGFIQQDSGVIDMFIAPAQCKAFGWILPPVGTRVLYSVASDPRTGRPRGEDVRPEFQRAQMSPQPLPDMRLIGVVSFSNKRYCWIAQAKGEPLFVLPQQCQTFGSVPPVGTPVTYAVEIGSKSGTPRATDVQRVCGFLTGTMKRIEENVKCGFIQPDNAQGDLLVMPPQCHRFGGKLPENGTRVMYMIGLDRHKQRPMAMDVQPQEQPHAAEDVLASNPKKYKRGAVFQAGDNFGFITQDDNEADMSSLPFHCKDFLFDKIPSVGDRVAFTVEVDAKTGRARAGRVVPEEVFFEIFSPVPKKASTIGSLPFQTSQYPVVLPNYSFKTGIMKKKETNGWSGFIQQDSGQDDLMVIPSECHLFGGLLPGNGTRVMYKIGLDGQKQRPMAIDVQPEKQARNVAVPDAFLVSDPSEYKQGAVEQAGGKSGFIAQDDDENDVFLLPSHCDDFFGGEIPPVGTRVAFTVEVDEIGSPRAALVVPEEVFVELAVGYANGWSKADELPALEEATAASPIPADEHPANAHSGWEMGIVRI